MAERVKLTEASDRHFVMVKGERVYFSFSRLFGPLLEDADGHVLERQPTSQSDPFWAPFSIWLNRWLIDHPAPKPRGHPSDHLDRRQALKDQDTNHD